MAKAKTEATEAEGGREGALAPTWRSRIVGDGEEAPDQLLANPRNWRIHPQHQQAALASVLDQVGWVQRVIVNQRTGFVLDGHLRVSLALRRNEPLVPVVYVDLNEQEEGLILATFDPIAGLAGADRDQLDALLRDVPTTDPDVQQMLADMAEAAGLDYAGGEPRDVPATGPPTDHPSLVDRFVVPPFTVLDSRQGYWQERKQRWLDWGLDPAAGRTAVDAAPDQMQGVLMTSWSSHPAFYPQKLAVEAELGHTLTTAEFERDYWEIPTESRLSSGHSLFDPVLCEVIYRWFCPPGGHVLDPFAGESTKGLVATALGFQYTGIEVRPEQVAANYEQAARLRLTPAWLVGDSLSLESLLPTEDRYDLVWTSPPYYDLEVYSRDERDGSTKQTYPEFMAWYRLIFEQAVARLKDDRFLAVKVGDVRDTNTGAYHNFLGDNIQTFLALGLAYYNEAVLVTPAGSLPIRTPHQFKRWRKLGKSHQNILVFYKGDPRRVAEVFEELADDMADLPGQAA